MIEPKKILKQRIVLVISIIILCLTITWSITSGEYEMDAATFFKTLMGQGEFMDHLILMEFRMPRMVITIMAGIALSLSGAVLQSITRNPLADPGLLGVNAGGGFAVALFISIGQTNPATFVYVLPAVSVIGGVAAAIFIFLFSYSKNEGVSPASMVLIGVGISSALSGASITIIRKFNEDQADFITRWSAGNIWGDEWTFVISLLPWFIVLVPFIFMKAQTLNLVNTHDDMSRSLGVNLNKERIILLIAAALLSSSAVAVAGSISFIGLMGPHIAKSMVGPRHQLFLPISMMVGGILLVTADTLGQIIMTEETIPAGIMVAIIGAPYFIYLMYRTRAV